MKMDTRCEIMLLSQFYDSFYITELIDKDHEMFANYDQAEDRDFHSHFDGEAKEGKYRDKKAHLQL